MYRDLRYRIRRWYRRVAAPLIEARERKFRVSREGARITWRGYFRAMRISQGVRERLELEEAAFRAKQERKWGERKYTPCGNVCCRPEDEKDLPRIGLDLP